jgi:hypothetical protein
MVDVLIIVVRYLATIVLLDFFTLCLFSRMLMFCEVRLFIFAEVCLLSLVVTLPGFVPAVVLLVPLRVGREGHSGGVKVKHGRYVSAKEPEREDELGVRREMGWETVVDGRGDGVLHKSGGAPSHTNYLGRLILHLASGIGACSGDAWTVAAVAFGLEQFHAHESTERLSTKEPGNGSGPNIFSAISPLFEK